jgi:hypothetical protein
MLVAMIRWQEHILVVDDGSCRRRGEAIWKGRKNRREEYTVSMCE